MHPHSLPVLALLGPALSAPVLSTPALPVSNALQNILDNTDNSELYTYPTALTQGIIPKPIHSHNDYWRPIPFYSALAVGAASIEADVWLFDDTLLVGHEEAALTPVRTFDSLYIQPILDVLSQTNPANSPYVDASAKPNGVFDTASGQTLFLFVDVKTDGPETWPYVVQALAPLRSAGYLTTFNGTGVTQGPVTVIGTGNTPQANFTTDAPRDYFLDANLALLSDEQSNITAAVSPVASTQFSRYVGEINGTEFNATQLGIVREQIGVAAERGILARYWDTPGWPVGTRNAVWRTLIEEGVGLLNADDLAAAAGYVGTTEPFQ
ncbi:uncharacterized protein HMPREF1541_10172 [Cyphellophora europaea CBS 101466]|uniref:Altered inheritance of mitochondria protein 6 n=1 Tax=Cyphellophora europaea (strain CBS 101466) TaxID=1220924 RepID=W2S746_CYPE1|nr:uncharacterized protein HMPREF1541_10172 [Cyphellophora europaea CBS 101466]ETN44502.1 hypothetical protein HMPREF1541_10172 [Cyphellophora europaea CBS 101466]